MDRQLTVRALDAAEDPGWAGVVALLEAHNQERDQPLPAAAFRDFALRRMTDVRALLSAGRGAWFVAETDHRVVGTLGVIVTDARARYQSVNTLASYRRRGIASRLVVEAADWIARRWPVEVFVIAAEAGYHALGLYEGLGFQRVEQVTGVWRRPA